MANLMAENKTWYELKERWLDAHNTCPKCHSDLVRRWHYEGDRAIPECHYWQCDDCGYQWGHE